MNSRKPFPALVFHGVKRHLLQNGEIIYRNALQIVFIKIRLTWRIWLGLTQYAYLLDNKFEYVTIIMARLYLISVQRNWLTSTLNFSANLLYSFLLYLDCFFAILTCYINKLLAPIYWLCMNDRICLWQILY